MELNSVQVKALATVARAELTDEEAVAAYLSRNGTASEKQTPCVSAPKRAAKVTTPIKASAKRERKVGSNVDRVREDINAHPHTGVADIMARLGLNRGPVAGALTQLKKAKEIEGVGNKRDMTYTVT